ncbi:MAG TPA: DUF2017 family protein [Candidatus Micrarchaeaceae archaeon]|nr:DUF2017 family protein [Candidatus Micrarchaeaceae archaeon]
MAQISRQGELVYLRMSRGERRALRQILERLEPLIDHSRWAHPRAYQEDEDEAEFQRLVGTDLADSRAADLTQVREALEGEARILLSSDQAMAWLRALNLLRLALAERLEITADGWEEKYTVQEHRRPPLATLHLLSWVQEGLVEALSVD